MAFKPCTMGICSVISIPVSNVSIGSAHQLSPRIRSFSPLSEKLKRRYATIQDHHSRGWSKPSAKKTEDLPAWPKTKHPTPYEIFGISKGTKYNKRNFYQLVKLYHPDTNDRNSSPSSTNSDHTVPHDTRLERYRLIVAANELLSDPLKRRLYDNHGIGWTHRDPRETLRDLDRNWRDQPGNAANNATWEDWERWHNAHNGKSSGPVYMSHGMFASIVVVMCMIGAMAQSNRAGTAGEQYVQWMADQNAQIGSQLRRSGMEAAGRSKDERVDYFLKDRENVNYRFEPQKYDPTEQHRPS